MSAIPQKREFVSKRIAQSEADAEFIEQMKRVMQGQGLVLDRMTQAAVDETAEYIRERKQ